MIGPAVHRSNEHSGLGSIVDQFKMNDRLTYSEIHKSHSSGRVGGFMWTSDRFVPGEQGLGYFFGTDCG